MRREHAALFRLFAELDASNIEALRAFAKRYGWLGKLPRQSQPPSQGVKFAEGESQLTWAIEIARMRKAVRWLDKRPPTLSGRDREWWDWLFNVQLQGVQARISFAEEGPKTLRLAPTTLLSAMWLQLAMAVAWNKSFVKCKFCQTSIEISTAESGFRTNREFCSDSCKTKDYRKRKRTAKRLVEKGKSIAAISTEISTDEKTVRGWFPQLERRSGAKSGRAR